MVSRMKTPSVQIRLKCWRMINNPNHVIRTEALKKVQLFKTPLVSQRLRPAAFLVSLVPSSLRRFLARMRMQ